MEAAEKVGKSAMSTEKAIQCIAKESETTFQEAMTKQAPPHDPAIKLVDVTHKLFEKPAHPEFPSSSTCIYKGIISNLISWGRGDQQERLLGIMSGDGKSVLDVVICTDLQVCLSSSRFAERLTHFQVQTMGLAVWVKEFPTTIDGYVEKLKVLKSPLQKLVLLVICGGHDPILWEVDIPTEGDVTCTRCSGPKESSGRKKQEKYRVVDFDALSKTTTDNMTDAVSTVFRGTLAELVSKKLANLEVRDTCNLQEYYVPADGFCLWHSILGSLEFESYITVPRKESGYSSNNRIVKSEEERARSLMETTLAKASEMGAVSSTTLAEINRIGSVDVRDLHWIAAALKFNIRCTMSDKAESVGFEGRVA